MCAAWPNALEAPDAELRISYQLHVDRIELFAEMTKMILCILIAKLRQVLNMRILCGGGREQRRGKGLCIRYGNDRDIHATFRYDIDSYRHQKSCATTPGGSSFFIGLRLSLNVEGGSKCYCFNSEINVKGGSNNYCLNWNIYSIWVLSGCRLQPAAGRGRRRRGCRGHCGLLLVAARVRSRPPAERIKAAD